MIITNILLDIIAKILKITQNEQIPIMFMGGLAISVWAEPRATYDIDGVIDIERSNLENFLKELTKEGFIYDKSNPIKLIQNLPFITLIYPIEEQEIYIDLFLAKSRYSKEALVRKQNVKIGNLTIPVIAPEDTILYKLLAGRTRDIEDIHQILIIQRGKLDLKYMMKWAEKLGIKTFLNDEVKSAEDTEDTDY
ncbi:MAG: nucleotidyl transferase AbiEii/AbiGii toxin family protein [bacterium]